LQGAPYADALAFASKYLSERRADNLLGVGTELPEFLNRERVALSKTITDSREQATKLKEQLEELWRDDGSAEYELCSVFIHRGTSPSWGHYFFYSRNLPDDPDSWFKYNDSDVSVVSKEEVLADTTGSTANPYLVSVSSHSFRVSIAHSLL
jgi:ubiquitin carboxyl-terminal hydrolase 25/28